jgi:hypothetical protein
LTAAEPKSSRKGGRLFPGITRQARAAEGKSLRLGFARIKSALEMNDIIARGCKILTALWLAKLHFAKHRLLPAYAQNFLPSSVTSRPIKGETPTIELVLGYKKSNEYSFHCIATLPR